MSKKMGRPKKTRIDYILDSFISVQERKWYPWRWPDIAWWEKNSKDDSEEINKFIRKVREYSLADLFFFSDEILRNPGDPHLDTNLHAELCHILQNSDSDIGILWPRNHLKSTICSVNWPIWRLGQNPNLRILIASDTLRVAKTFMKLIKENIIYNPKLKYIFPNLKPAEEVGNSIFRCWNSMEIEVARSKRLKEPSVTVMSAGQDTAGLHYDLHIYDDIMTDKNTQNDDSIQTLIDWYEQTLNLMDREAREVVIGTRRRDNDLYGYLMERGEIPFHTRKAVEDGSYIWPDPFSIARVEKMRRKLTPYNFSCQYMNDPIVKGDQEFEEEWLRYWNYNTIREMVPNPPDNNEELLTTWVKTLDVYMGCDPARTDKKSSDYTVIMVAGMDIHGNLYILEFLRKKYKTHEITAEFIRMFDKWNPKSAKVETYGGDIHVYNNIKKMMKEQNKAYTKVSEYEKNMRLSGDDRIRVLQSPLQGGFIFINQESAISSELEIEFLRFPYGKHDDILTTLAYIYSQQTKPKKEKVENPVLRGWNARFLNKNRSRRGTGSWMTA